MSQPALSYCYQPIQQMQFKGLHWIEASAGTGKTFTLSSLMVRIFLKDYLPAQVIATTFTRAAAAELKSRIRLRLMQTRQYFLSCQGLSQREIQQKIQQEHDPLLQKVLSDYAQQVDYAAARLQLVIDQLDELFVGTLDSFSQKLLREFSFESGKIERAEITDRSDDYVEQLVHDVLREWIQAQPQETINHLLAKGLLKAPEHYVDIVRQSLNFASVQIQPVAVQKLNTEQLLHCLNTLASLTTAQLQELVPYYAGQYTHAFSVHAAGKNGEKIAQIFTTVLPDLIQRLQQDPIAQFFNPNLKGKFHTLFSLFLDSKGEWRKKIFNAPKKTCSEEDQQAFLQHPVILAIQALIEANFSFQQQLDQLDSVLKFHLSNEVKQRLPQLLQQKGETTFSQQIRTLAEALQGEHGQRFAQFVHARYPLILVDEFQDTNQDQDDMLATIWRNAKWYQRGCMIMVGDPKQAIYAFRGGDMLTYNQARRDVIEKKGTLYSLVHNHRSVKDLVAVVDELFHRQIDFGEQVYYQPVQAGPRPHPDLVEHNQTNRFPLRWFEIPSDQQAEIQIAWKIREILNQAQQKQLFFTGDVPSNVQAEDIAILSTSHRSLDAVQYELERLGIRVNRNNKRSVFAGFLAKDVAAILTAILHPYDEAKVKRALLTRLLGYNLKQLIELEKQGLGRFIYDFDCIREMWVNKGFLTAWNYCLNLFKVWENLVAKQSFDNERLVVNLRHLTDLLSKQSERRQGAYMLYQWYLKHLDAPGDREWEKERKLSSADGVQLMTVHQSKGLEFKIVFLMEADQAKKTDSNPLIFSTEQQAQQEKRIISIRDAAVPEQALQQHQARIQAEQNRLWYVALTRASHRVYAVVKSTTEVGAKVSDLALNFWRMRPHADAEMAMLAEQYSCIEPICNALPPALKLNEQHQLHLVAQAFPTRGFYPRSKTSFSALAQHLKVYQQQDSLVQSESVEALAADEDHQQVVIESSNKQPLNWIRAQFPRGTNAGSFLHKLFEHIGFHDAIEHIAEEVKLRFKNDKEFQSELLLQELVEKSGLADVDEAKNQIYEAVAHWLYDVLHTPLHESFELQHLADVAYLAEFPFYMALSDRRLFVEKIKSRFDQIQKPIHDLKDATTARYLNGSIDLVYFDGQRYHIADYKSNFLGTDQSHYTPAEIAANMSHSSYWLQAALYLVAMHRYLTATLPDYDIAQHLGGASYLYLRGMQGQPNQGYYYWKPEDDFILELDELLGYFEQNEKLSE